MHLLEYLLSCSPASCSRQTHREMRSTPTTKLVTYIWLIYQMIWLNALPHTDTHNTPPCARSHAESYHTLTQVTTGAVTDSQTQYILMRQSELH